MNIFNLAEEFGAVNNINTFLESPKTVDVEDASRFSTLALREIICTILSIDVNSWNELLDARKMKPVKAAIKLGANEGLAQLVADLKLATTEKDINDVYQDERCRSCMTGERVGAFWSLNNVGIIYSPNFRVLVGLKTFGLNPRAYGYKGDKVYDILQPFFKEGAYPLETEYELIQVERLSGHIEEEYREVNLWSMTFSEEDYKTVKNNLAVSLELLKKAIDKRGYRGGFSMFNPASFYTLPDILGGGTLKLSKKEFVVDTEECSRQNSFMHTFKSKLPEEYKDYISNIGLTPVEDLHDTSLSFLEVVNAIKKIPQYEEETAVMRTPKIKIKGDLIVPFLDFDDEVLSREESEKKIKELGLTEPETLTLIDLDNSEYDFTLPEGEVFANIVL